MQKDKKKRESGNPLSLLREKEKNYLPIAALVPAIWP